MWASSPVVLGYVSTEHYSYQELFHEVNIQTGGIASSINVYGDDEGVPGLYAGV